MTKKIIEPDSSEAKKPLPEEKSDKKNDVPTKAKSEIAKGSSLNMPTIVTAALVIGFVVSIAASYGVQRYRDIYVIPPQKEKTFLFLTNAESNGGKLRNLIVESNNSPILTFSDSNLDDKDILIFKILSNGTVLSLEEMEYYEFGVPEFHSGGKLTFYYNYLEAVINYVIQPDEKISIVMNVNGKRPDGKSNELMLSVQHGSMEPVIIPLESGAHTFPGEDFPINTEELNAQINELTTKWENKITKIFSAGQQQLPKAYLELVQSAYSFVANSLNVKKSAEFIGIYQNFTLSDSFYYLQPHNFILNNLDEQIFGLMTLSKLESEDTLRVLKSWISSSNELGYMGNRINEGRITLSKIQAPLLFQLIKELLDNPLFQDKFQGIADNLEFVAENTWKNSVGAEGLEKVKCLGSSSGIFGPEAATPDSSSSFELLCLLGDMCRVMQKVSEITGATGSSKWADRFSDVDATMAKYWHDVSKHYGEMEKGKIKKSASQHVPVILGLLNKDDNKLKQLLENLQQDPNFLPFGYQVSEEQGVRVGTNYLLIQSLKRYSEQSGPSQELAHNMYSVLKNHLAAVIARANRVDKSFYGRYDKNMQPIGPKGNPDGTLVFAIMSSQ